MAGEPAAGIYVHVPYCSVVCPYCDFAVRPGKAPRRRRYVDHLLREVELRAAAPHPASDTIYLGGGTPSCLAADDLGRLLAVLRARLPVAAETHVTMEANPEDVSRETLAAWRELGVHTLSLGVQSFDAETLRFLGRRHDAATARRSVELALAAGFAVVSVDLIYGLPGQDVAGWRRELETAAALEPEHLSCYQLTVHPDTAFGILERRGQLEQLPDAEQAELFRVTHRALSDLGYAAYEVSNFARRTTHRSRHNMKYWHHVPYVGLGPSAHSFDGRERSWNVRGVDEWETAVAAGRVPVAGSETPDARALALEALMLGLRTTDGVDADRVIRLTGLDVLAANRERLAGLEARGLVRVDGRRLVPTLEGLAIADGLAAELDVRPHADAQT